MSELETRSAQLVDVSYPKRLIELIVMPYETEAEITEHGRTFTEICSRGAYDGMQVRTSTIRANREHDLMRTCGKAEALHPSREEGLVADVKMSRTELGEETLQLADDGILDASAGFMLLRRGGSTGPVVPNAETWETRTRRRLNHLYLHHIALTANAAHPGSVVLGVRNTLPGDGLEVGTPNRDRIEIDELIRRRDVIDLRYGLKR
jgi:phage head maturation protease